MFRICFRLMACWRRLHLQFRHRWTSGRTSKSSNGRKIARMARNSTIFGPNESSRRDLFLEKFSKSRNNRKVFEKLRKIFEKKFEKFFERCNLMGDVILSKTSLKQAGNCSAHLLHRTFAALKADGSVVTWGNIAV